MLAPSGLSGLRVRDGLNAAPSAAGSVAGRMGAPEYFDSRLAKALSHPLRPQILDVLTTRGEASPVQIAAELRAPLGTVSYHVRMLKDLECIELVRTVPRRGAVEHYYRALVAPFLDDEQWAQLPLMMRRQLASQTIGQVVTAAVQAAGRGGFDPTGAHVDRVTLRLDEQGWSELSEALRGVLDSAAEIQRRADERGTDNGETTDSELAVLHYAVARRDG
jgi:DNA-binding transcriptional ArsR family regulator